MFNLQEKHFVRQLLNSISNEVMCMVYKRTILLHFFIAIGGIH